MRNFEITCSNCGVQEILLSGESIAISSNDKPPIAWILPEGKDQGILLDLLNSGNVAYYKRPYIILQCPQCNTVTSNTAFIAQDKNRKILFRTQHHCEQCHALLTPTRKHLSRFCCKKCGQRALTSKEVKLCVD